MHAPFQRPDVDALKRIPIEMRAVPNWLVWRLEHAPGRPKPTKIPYHPVTGAKMSVTKDDGTTFKVACETMLNGGNYNGVGYILKKGGPFTAFDLDDPEGDNVKAAYQQSILERFPSYTERSPSGKGIRIIVKGTLPKGIARKDLGVEIYPHDRYVTMTGDVTRALPIVDCQAELNRLVAEIEASTSARNARSKPSMDDPRTLTDEEVLAMCRKLGGKVFAHLWAGNWQAVRGARGRNGKWDPRAQRYESQSDADLALMAMLARVSRNRSQVKDLFMQSGLGGRPKADRDDYIERTLEKAFVGVMTDAQIAADLFSEDEPDPSVDEDAEPNPFGDEDNEPNPSEGEDEPNPFVDEEDEDRPNPSGDEAKAEDTSRHFAEEPTPLYPEPLPAEPYPVEALGSVLAPAVEAISRAVKVPHAMAAQSVLGAASLTTQPLANVMMPFGQARPISLGFLTGADSGDRKSSADNDALEAVEEYVSELINRNRGERFEWKNRAAAWAVQRRRIENNKNLDLEQQTAELGRLGPKPGEPLKPMVLINDATVEGMVKDWVNAPASLGLFSAEGGIWIGGYGMSEEQKLKSGAVFSCLWDGKPYTKSRASEEAIVLRNRRLTINVMVQPEILKAFLGDAVLKHQGLFSRMLIAMPDSLAGTRFYEDPTDEDRAAIAAFNEHLKAILDAGYVVENRNELKLRPMSMSSDAVKAWVRFHDAVEVRLKAGEGDLSVVKDMVNKVNENLARLAAVLTLVETAPDPVPGSVNGPGATWYTEELDEDGVATLKDWAPRPLPEISADTMTRAATVMDWYLGEIVRHQKNGVIDDDLKRASDLLRFMRKQAKEKGQVLFKVRDDLQQLGPIRVKDDLNMAIATLKEHGWVKEHTARPLVVVLFHRGENTTQ